MRLSVAVAAVCLSIIGLANADETQAAIRKSTSIPAEGLVPALKQLAHERGLQVVFQSEVVGSTQTRGAAGELTTAEALTQLLAGSDLAYRYLDEKTVTIVPAASTQAQVQGAGGSGVNDQEGNKSASGGGTLLAQVDQGQTPSATTVEQSKEKTETEKAKEKEGLEQLQVVVVTGTHIRGEAPVGSPIIVLDQDYILRSGVTTVEDLLGTLPQNFKGGHSSLSPIGLQPLPAAGFDESYGASANLRGLGAGSQLVLINGARLPMSGLGADHADISMIPLSAIDHVDILTDGASAIYGSDAVSGVINFVLKSHYDGSETNLTAESPTRSGGGQQYHASELLGTSWSSGNALLSYEFSKVASLYASDRSFSASSLSPTLPDYPLTAGQKEDALYLHLRQDLTSSVTASLDMLGTKRDAAFTSLQSFDVPPSPQFTTAKPRQYDGTLSIQARPTDAWTLSTALTAGRNKNAFQYIDLIDSPTPTTTNTRDDLFLADVNASGTLLTLPSGQVKLAFGGEYRHEKLTFTQTGVTGINTSVENDKSEYAEVLVPIIGARQTQTGSPRLVLDAAVRHDDYSTFGGTTNPKIGILWNASSHLNLRASYGRSFQTPTLEELNEFNNTNGSTTLLPNPNAPGSETLILSGNNPNLGPQKATTTTAGVDFKPEWLSGSQFSATLFDIKYKSQILAPASLGDIFTILSNPQDAPLVTLRNPNNSSGFDNAVTEFLSGAHGSVYNCPVPLDPVTGGCPEPASAYGAIVDFRLRNFATTRQSGIDLNANQALPLAGGKLDLSANAAILLRFDQQSGSTVPSVSVRNQPFEPSTLRLHGGASWARAGWTLSTWLNYQNAYSNTLTTPISNVKANFTADVNVGYKFADSSASALQGVTAALTVRNVFDSNPPYLATPAQGLFNANPGFDPANADPYGRVIALSFSKRFGQ